MGCKSCKIFRQWVNKFCIAIPELEVALIDFSRHFDNWDGRVICLMSIDGTDVKINEPLPFHLIWWSHKHNSAGLCNEIGVCIQTGHIVWFNGPFPCGIPDLLIFDLSLSKKVTSECLC